MMHWLMKSANTGFSRSEGMTTPCRIVSFAPRDRAKAISGAAQSLMPVRGNTNPLLVRTGRVGYLMFSGNSNSTFAMPSDRCVKSSRFRLTKAFRQSAWPISAMAVG